MNNSKFFSVIVGDKPAKVQVGFLDEAGQPKDAAEAYISKGGTAVPNYSRVWGILVKEPKTKELTGEVEFLKWGSEKGEIIEIRYIPTISSLSVEYQKLKKVKLLDKDAEIHLSVGVNNFDKIKDRMLVMMLTYHYQNSENECRDPSIPVAFSTYDPQKVTKMQTTEVQIRHEAENIVIGANYENQELEVLASLFNGIDPRQQQDILFTELMEQTKNPKFFLEVMDHHRTEFETVMNDALEIQLINCDADDAIYIMKNGTKEFLIKDIEPSKEGVKIFVLKNFYKPDFFNALTKLKDALEEYKKLELQ